MLDDSSAHFCQETDNKLFFQVQRASFQNYVRRVADIEFKFHAVPTPFYPMQLKLTPDDSNLQFSIGHSSTEKEHLRLLAGLVPSQTSTMFVDERLYRFYNTLSAFSKALSLIKLRK
jgi:hypothetical protein